MPGSGTITNGMFTGGLAGKKSGWYYDMPFLSWGPRIGVAWDVTGDGKTAVRAAGGRDEYFVLESHPDVLCAWAVKVGAGSWHVARFTRPVPVGGLILWTRKEARYFDPSETRPKYLMTTEVEGLGEARAPDAAGRAARQSDVAFVDLDRPSWPTDSACVACM